MFPYVAVRSRAFALGLGLAALGLVASGCSRAPAPPAPAAVATPGLRGAKVDSGRCTPPKLPSGVNEPTGTVVAIPAVTSLTWCPYLDGRAPLVLLPGSRRFSILAADLSQPNDATPRPLCRLYESVLFRVLAATPTGQYWLEVPHDTCRHYLAMPGLDDL